MYRRCSLTGAVPETADVAGSVATPGGNCSNGLDGHDFLGQLRLGAQSQSVYMVRLQGQVYRAGHRLAIRC